MTCACVRVRTRRSGFGILLDFLEGIRSTYEWLKMAYSTIHAITIEPSDNKSPPLWVVCEAYLESPNLSTCTLIYVSSDPRLWNREAPRSRIVRCDRPSQLGSGIAPIKRYGKRPASRGTIELWQKAMDTCDGIQRMP